MMPKPPFLLAIGSMAIWIAVATVPAMADQQPAPAASPEEEAEHEALRQLRSVYESAIRENRIDALAPHLHPDFHGVMVTGREVDSLDDLKTFWSDIRALMGDGGSYATTVNAERSVILGEIALARGTTDDVVTTSRRQEFRFKSSWTAVLQKEDGKWKLRRVQGTIDPVDNPFVREFTKRATTGAAGVGALIGIVVGAVAAVLIGRRRAHRRVPV
jgi:ketosteroid isomerase-like protein